MIEWIRPQASAADARVAVFDFDGTLSLIRTGWVDTMVPMMVEILLDLKTGESEEDLRRISRDDLYAHYRRYCHPANAFVVAVGDFSTDELLERIERAFGAIPGGETAPRSLGVVEPRQRGERRPGRHEKEEEGERRAQR